MTKGIRELKANVREEISVLLTAQQGDYDCHVRPFCRAVFRDYLINSTITYWFRDEGAERQDAGKLAGTYIQSLVFWGSLKVGRW